MKNKIITLLFALLASVGTMKADVASGTCGANLSWTLINGTLIITGTGEMDDYQWWQGVYTPWYNHLDSIKTVIIQNGVTSIGNFAFERCSNITSVTIPNTVTRIGYASFEYCQNLTSITIPSSVTSIEDWAFSQCRRLNAVHISDLTAWLNISFGNISSNPLERAHHLYLDGTEVTNLIIPNNIDSIKPYAFSGCSSLTSITIPSNVVSIGAGAFNLCTGLNAVHISDLTAWLGIFYGGGGANPLESAHHLYLNNTEITSLTIPNGITSIGNYTFSGYSSLQSIELPNALENIGEYAFSRCSGLTNITIPASVQSIGRYAFTNNLNSATMLAEHPCTLGEHAFPYSANIIVPCGSIVEYMESWRNVDYHYQDQITRAMQTTETSVLYEHGHVDVFRTMCEESIIKAIANEGYHFTHWNDSNARDMRVVNDEPSNYIPTFEKDKHIIDWDSVPVEYSVEVTCPEDAAHLGLQSVKVYADTQYIYIMVEPNMEEIQDLSIVPFHVYIDVDNSDLTGGYGDIFIDANTDIMLEGYLFMDGEVNNYDPAVYRWWGEVGGSGWTWTDPSVENSADNCWGALVCENSGVATSRFGSGKFEIMIDRTKIPMQFNDTMFGVGFEIEQNWSWVGILPCVSLSNDDWYGYTNKLKVKIDKSGKSYQENRCGDNLIWEIEDGNLIISGTGDMWNNYVGFHSHDLTSVTVNDGATSICGQAFSGQKHLQTLTIGSDVRLLGEQAFYNCNNLKTIYNYRSTPTNVYSNTFDGVDKFECVLHVPSASVKLYKAASVWRDFYYIMGLDSLPVDNGYTITYVDKNFAPIDSEEVVLHLPDAPIIEGFTFLYWQPISENIDNGIRIQAIYETIEPESAPEVYTNPANPAQKLIRNGNVYILTDSHTYTITGQEVR